MKAVRTAAFVIGAAALVATGVGAAVGAGILGGVAAAGTAATFAGLSAATFTTIGVALSAAAGALSLAAGAAAPKGTVGGNATKFKIDKEAGIPVAIGRTYVGGNVVHRQYYNRPGDKMKNQLESWVTILSLGLVQSVGPLLIDKTPVAFDAGGQALGTYRGNMWLDTQRGACPEGRALAGPFGAFPGWDGSSRLSGLAADLWTLDFDSKGEKFPNGVPDRGRVLEGVLVYDPRRDSTYPGGNGPCRLGQPATYVYSENPGPHAITWAYGHYQNGVLVAGGGLSAGGIDMAPYVEWSNVCDANGWKVGGVVYATTDDAWDVLKMICQAGSATPLPVGAQLSVTFSAPRVSIGTISSADISGDVDVPATVARRTRRNTLIPSVRLESHGWEMVPLDPVSVPAYIAIDGGRRPREVSYPLVQDARQGAQLALYEMLNDRELSGIVVPAKVYALGYRPGDCITLQIPEANLIGREVVIGQRELDVGTNGVTLVCRSEDNSKHAFALGKTTTPPRTPDLSNPGIDRTAPDATDWTAAGTTLSANGVDVPAIVITSLVDRIAADEIVFDYRPRIAGASPDVNWTGASIEPSSVLRKEITSVTPNTAYDVGIRYRIRGAVSARLIIENVTVGNAALPWGNIGDDGKKPEDNATVGAPEGTNIGGRPVTDVLAAFDAAQAQQNHFETVTIPAVEKAVADAGERITAAKGRADDAYDRAGQAIEDAETVNRRVDTLIAEGGGGSDGVDSVARAEIKRVDEAAIGRDDAVARSVETLSASYTSGGNLLSNTDFALDTAGWTFASESESRGYRNQFSPDIYWPAGTAALITYQPNTSPARAGLWYQPVYGLEGGASYQVSAYVASHRATAGIYIDQFRADGAIVGHSEVASAKFNTGTRNLSADYERLVVNFVAHPDASYLILYMIKYGTVPGADPADSYSWFLRPQVVKVRAGVTAAVPYMPGSGDAGRIATDARVSREVVALAEADAALARDSFAIEARMGERVSASARDVTTAFTEADRALGSRTSNLEASAAGPVGGSLNPNPAFVGWSNADTTPNGWAYWNVIDKVTRIDNPFNRGGYAVAQTPTNPNSGIWCPDILVPNGWFVMDVIVHKADGTWAGAGVTLNGQHGIDFLRTPDNAGVVGDTPNGVTRTWSFLFQVRDDFIGPGFKNWHAMSNWTGYMADLYPKTLWWLHCGLRPASQGEIEANKAINVSIPAVAARVKAAEDTLADLPNRFASAQRTIDLEAQVNGETGSRLLSRATEQATVIADAKAGVVAQSVETLRTEYNGRIGVVEQQAGSITGIDGRTEVYWRVTGTTNDGATQISLTKKDGSSPLFYIGANTLIDGNLMVTGTITTRVIQNGSITNSVTTTGGSYQFAQNTRQQTGEAYLQPSGTGFVRIDVRLSTNYVDGESGVTAPNKWLLQLYRDQDGQTRFVGSTEFREGPYIPFLDIDVPTSTSLCRYYVVCTLTVAQRTGFVFNTKIIATESKK